MKTSLPEIFDDVKKAESLDEKKNILKENYSVALAACLKMLFDPTITLALPVGLPEDYKFNNMPYSSLERVIRSIPPLVNLPEGPKLEKAWLRLIQPLSKEDVTLLTSLKDKDLDIGLTLPDIQALFPGLFSNITPEVLEKVKTDKEASTEPKDVDNSGSKTPEPSVGLPDDIHTGEPLKIEEDESLPTPISENPGVEGIQEVLIESETVRETEKNQKEETPKKSPKNSTQKKASKKKD